jgi:hypothetical protein
MIVSGTDVASGFPTHLTWETSTDTEVRLPASTLFRSVTGSCCSACLVSPPPSFCSKNLRADEMMKEVLGSMAWTKKVPAKSEDKFICALVV